MYDPVMDDLDRHLEREHALEILVENMLEDEDWEPCRLCDFAADGDRMDVFPCEMCMQVYQEQMEEQYWEAEIDRVREAEDAFLDDWGD